MEPMLGFQPRLESAVRARTALQSAEVDKQRWWCEVLHNVYTQKDTHTGHLMLQRRQ